jgi:hypothetical protein
MRHRRKQLEKEGWLRQFVADIPLANNAVEIYDLLGYEVRLQPPNRSHSKKGTSSSSEESQGQCQIVYVRPKKSQDDEDE